jgi:hypothetical protein
MVVAFVAMVVVALLAATPAWASQVSDVSVVLDRNHAGQQALYQVSFTTPSGLTGNDSITIDAPAGTVFPDGDPILGTLPYTLKDAQASHFIPASNVSLSNDGSTVTLNLAGLKSGPYAPPGTRVTISIVSVTNPPEPGTYSLAVRTSKDSEIAESAPYTILPGLVGGPPPVPEGPTSKEQCKKGGYEAFDFRNQGQCVASVERGPKNKGGMPSS